MILQYAEYDLDVRIKTRLFSGVGVCLIRRGKEWRLNMKTAPQPAPLQPHRPQL